MKNKVLLVYAGEKTRLPRLPIGIIVLAAYIREHGFDPYIFDTRVDEKIPWALDDFLAVGVSAMSINLKYGIKVVEEIKKEYPSMIFIWGGCHVTFLPEQSVKSKYVDIVVKGEGEESLLEVLQVLQKNELPKEVKGVAYFDKEKQTVINNPNREFIDMDDLPFPAYDLVDINKYADMGDQFSYESSRGCSHRCTFCYVHIFHNRKWRTKSINKILDEVGRLIKEYKIKRLHFIDDNVFLDKKRILAITKGFIDRKFGIEWQAMARANYIAYYSDEEMKFLKKSGWWNALIGGESGSDRILKMIQKDITTEEIKKSVIKCIHAGIKPMVSFMIGFPGEDEKVDLPKTLKFYSELKSLAKNTEDIEINGLFIYTPYPGTPLYDKAIKIGYKPPENFEGWTNWLFNDTSNIPWSSRRLKMKLSAISTIVRFWYYLERIKDYSKRYQEEKVQLGFLGKILFKIGIPILKVSAHLRWKTGFFYFPYEWDLFRWYRDRHTEVK
jgi:radical SAM superfamily enzyme YgiQ (UPF0313 family)